MKDKLYIRTTQPGSLVHIYTANGMLLHTETIQAAGETKINLSPGIYIVTLNNHTGQKIRID
ncbi:MAG: T9SS type A sorting domain-containing protein [Tannerella sp.]|nr:T9SS type A sorting domain-containing protein [Tannerella sp.]